MKHKYPDWILPTALIIIAILGIPLFALYQFEYWKGLDGKKDYDLLSIVISLSVGILNVITIVFLYINYRQQQKEIDDNKKDVEYNRTLDLLYKHLPNTISINFKTFLYKQICDILSMKGGTPVKVPAFAAIYFEVNEYIDEVLAQLKFIEGLINNKNFSAEDKKMLKQIAVSSVGKQFFKNLALAEAHLKYNGSSTEDSNEKAKKLYEWIQ